MKVLDFISIVPWTIVAQICNLFIMVFILKKFLFKPVQEVLAKRQKEIDDNYAAAEEASAAAEAMREEYEEHLRGAREEAAELLKTATKRAEQRGEEIVDDAKKQAAAITLKAEKSIEQEKKKALESLKTEVGGLAVDLAEQIVGREISEEDHARLIDGFISDEGDGV